MLPRTLRGVLSMDTAAVPSNPRRQVIAIMCRCAAVLALSSLTACGGDGNVDIRHAKTPTPISSASGDSAANSHGQH